MLNIEETIFFDLGVGKAIELGYRVNKEVQKRVGFFKNKDKITYENEIEVINLGLSSVKIAILDSFPLANKIEKIKVSLN